VNRKLIRRIVLLLVVIFTAFALYGRFFSGEVRQREVSPDGKNIAECIEYADLSTVQLRTRLNPFRRVVISGLYDAGLSVVWIDSRNLLVRCQRCGELSIVGKKKAAWHNISIHYTAQFGF
jgi:hypothetical protein